MSQLTLKLDKPTEPGFIIDTMVLIGIGRIIYPPELKQSAREIVDKLVDEGKIKSSIEVYAEVYYKKKKSDGDETCLLADAYKAKNVFERISDVDQENVALILTQFPTFVKHDSERPDADPWLVTLAMRFNKWTIVSRDGEKDTDGMQRMKQVCRHFKIPYITDTEFYQSHGWNITSP
mgnify:CR=1 FL=1